MSHFSVFPLLISLSFGLGLKRPQDNEIDPFGFKRVSFYEMQTEAHTKEAERHWLTRTENEFPLFDQRTPTNTSSQFYVDLRDCSTERVIVFRGIEGMIRGFTNKNSSTDNFSDCYFQVIVPEDSYILAYSKVLIRYDVECRRHALFTASNEFEFRYPSFPVLGQWSCDSIYIKSKSPLLLTAGNVLYVKVFSFELTRPDNFWLYFKSITINLKESFKVVLHSYSDGYITLHSFDYNLHYMFGLNISYTLRLLHGHVLLLSFPHFDVHSKYFTTNCANDFLELQLVTKPGEQRTVWRKCKPQKIEPSVFNASVIFRFRSRDPYPRLGFKGLFSLHPIAEAPHKLPSGLFNCSRHYEAFRHHLDCNLRIECQHKEDETGTCPFSSSHCEGSVQQQVAVLQDSRSLKRVFPL